VACDLLKKMFVLDPRTAISRLPSMVDVYCRARLVPRWIKVRVKRLRNRNAEFRPYYEETIW
jgi:hypothetical protein